MTTPSADPWFQPLFADRIGGAGYGKGTEIYKFEKIKRAKRAALREHPERRQTRLVLGATTSIDASLRGAYLSHACPGFAEPSQRWCWQPPSRAARRRPT